MVLKAFLLLAAVAAASGSVIVETGDKAAVATPPAIQGSSRCTPLKDKAPKKREGSRCSRLTAKHKRGKLLANKPPIISLATSGTGPVLGVTSTAKDPDGDTLIYTYSVTGGRISGEGATASWDLSSAMPGTYTLTAEVDDGCGCIAFNSTNFTFQ